MEKLAGLLAAAAAIAVALYLILARRPLPTGQRGGRLGARFALMVTGFVWLLGGCRAPAEKPPPRDPRGSPKGSGQKGPGPKGSGPKGAMVSPRPSKASRLEARTEWQQLQKAWLAVGSLKVTRTSSLKPAIASLRAANQKLTDRLVKDGLMDKDGAQVFNDIYADRVFHQLRPLTSSCYDPTALGSQIQMTRTGLEKRLTLIAGFARAGKVKPAVAQKVESSVARSLEILLLVNVHWKKGWKGNRKAYQAEESRIMALFVGLSPNPPRIKDTLKLRPGIPKAMKIIKRIYTR